MAKNEKKLTVLKTQDAVAIADEQLAQANGGATFAQNLGIYISPVYLNPAILVMGKTSVTY